MQHGERASVIKVSLCITGVRALSTLIIACTVLESLANYISSNLKDFKQMHKHHQAMKPFLKARAAKKAAVGKHTGRSRAKRASPAAQKATKPAVTATTEARLTPEALPSSNIFGPLSSQVRVSQPVQAAVPAVPAAVPSFIQTRPARSVHPATAGLAEKIDRLAKEGVSLATPSPTPSAAPAGKIKPPSLLHELDPYATIDTGLNHIKTTLQAVAKEMKYRYFLNVKNHWFKGVKEVNGQLEDMRYEPEEEERCDEVLTGIGEAVGLGKGGKVAKPTGRPRNGTQGSVGTIRVA